MDDLISREAVLNELGECPDNWQDSPEEVEAVNSWCYAVNAIHAVPSVSAVPLDKLCEWLQENASLTHGTLISAAGWKYELTKWMEGLNGTD